MLLEEYFVQKIVGNNLNGYIWLRSIRFTDFQ